MSTQGSDSPRPTSPLSLFPDHIPQVSQEQAASKVLHELITTFDAHPSMVSPDQRLYAKIMFIFTTAPESLEKSKSIGDLIETPELSPSSLALLAQTFIPIAYVESQAYAIGIEEPEAFILRKLLLHPNCPLNVRDACIDSLGILANRGLMTAAYGLCDTIQNKELPVAVRRKCLDALTSAVEKYSVAEPPVRGSGFVSHHVIDALSEVAYTQDCPSSFRQHSINALCSLAEKEPSRCLAKLRSIVCSPNCPKEILQQSIGTIISVVQSGIPDGPYHLRMLVCDPSCPETVRKVSAAALIAQAKRSNSGAICELSILACNPNCPEEIRQESIVPLRELMRPGLAAGYFKTLDTGWFTTYALVDASVKFGFPAEGQDQILGSVIEYAQDGNPAAMSRVEEIVSALSEYRDLRLPPETIQHTLRAIADSSLRQLENSFLEASAMNMLSKVASCRFCPPDVLQNIGSTLIEDPFRKGAEDVLFTIQARIPEMQDRIPEARELDSRISLLRRPPSVTRPWQLDL